MLARIEIACHFHIIEGRGNTISLQAALPRPGRHAPAGFWDTLDIQGSERTHAL